MRQEIWITVGVASNAAVLGLLFLWHCVACSSNELSLGAEYHFRTNMWRMRNPNPRRSYFREKTR
jgi:hypothetical protein